MRYHHDAISRQMQIGLDSMAPGLNRALECLHGVFREVFLEAAVGDRLG
jgi:hypothetical protein